MKMKRGQGLYLILATCCIAGCKPPDRPVITPAGSPITMAPGQSKVFTANSEASQGEVVYTWELAGDGEISRPTGAAVVFTAPKKDGAMALLSVKAQNKHGASPQASVAISVPSTGYVYLEEVGIPAGWMAGGGEPVSFIRMESGAGECRSQNDCVRFSYSTGGEWAGIFWWPKTCGPSGTPQAWERFKRGFCGTDVLGHGGLGSVSRLSFWARGLKGGEVIEFRVGADDAKPSPGKSLPKTTLASRWQRYEIDLEDVDLTNATALFLWTATDLDNPGGAAFLLDDVRFEGFKKQQSSS